MKRYFRSGVIGFCVAVCVFGPVQRVRAAVPLVPLVWMGAEIFGGALVSAGVNHLISIPASVPPLKALAAADGYAPSAGKIILPAVSSWKTRTGGLIKNVADKLGLSGVGGGKLGRYVSLGVSLTATGAAVLANGSMAPTLAAKYAASGTFSNNLTGWLQGLSTGNIFTHPAYPSGNKYRLLNQYEAMQPTNASSYLGQYLSACLAENNYNNVCMANSVNVEGYINVYQSINPPSASNQWLVGRVRAELATGNPVAGPASETDYARVQAALNALNAQEKAAATNEMNNLIAGGKIPPADIDIRGNNAGAGVDTITNTTYEYARPLHSEGESTYDALNNTTKADARDVVAEQIDILRQALSSKLEQLKNLQKAAAAKETVTSKDLAEIAVAQTEAQTLSAELAEVVSSANGEFGIPITQLNPDGSSSASSASQSASEPIPVPPVVYPPVTPYSVNVGDFGARLELMVSRLKTSGIFSLPGQFALGLPAGGDPEISFDAGSLGIHHFSFASWSGYFAIMRGFVLLCAGWTAIRLVVINKG